jgi:YjbE family integral membrane protein
VASIVQYLGTSHWGALLGAGVASWGDATFWFAALQIVFINLLLSGDNAVVIAMACRGLPPRQRLWGLVIGAGLSVVLLIVFAGIIARLMVLPYLKLVGGLALLGIAAKLLVPEKPDKDEVEAVAHLWRAVRTVLVADVVMSLDNVIAVAATAKGDLILLGIGLAASIPIVVAGAALITALLERFPVFVWAGAALLGWVAGDAMATDPAVLRYTTAAFGGDFAQQLELAAAAASVLLVIAAGGLWRHLRLSKMRAGSSG